LTAKARLRATILGCGASYGVPRIGNDWGDCDPNEPKNRRSRSGLLVERFGEGGRQTTVLVDTGPELRLQLLAADVRHIDAVIYTHAHADHIHGIDDLRSFWLISRRLVDVYSDAATAARLDQGFSYCFRRAPGSNYPPILKHHEIAAGVPFAIDGAGGPIDNWPFRQIHGEIESLGFRFGDFAYSSDVSDFPEESVPAIAGLDVWIVDALRYAVHGSHLTVAQAVAWIERMRAVRGILTHMHTDLDYWRLRGELPAHIEPAHDLMRIEFEA
jgi:phosphoribosyl 1,2-cyclic phosphate phosphodiesterase